MKNPSRLMGISAFVVLITLLGVSCSSSGPGVSNGTEISETTIATVADQILQGGEYAALPFSGEYIQAGQTLTLSWSADDTLEGYIFTETQFNNFKSAGIPSGYMAYRKGSSGTISYKAQNDDKYWGIVTNRAIVASSVKLYEAKLSLR